MPVQFIYSAVSCGSKTSKKSQDWWASIKGRQKSMVKKEVVIHEQTASAEDLPVLFA